MPSLHIVSDCPLGENFVLYIDDALIDDELVAVGNEFRLKLVQNRFAHTSKNVSEMLSQITQKLRRSRLPEMSTPYHAEFEAVCKLKQDGELSVVMRKTKNHSCFDVTSDTIQIQVLKNKEEMTDRERMIWLISNVLMCVLFLIIAGIGITLLWSSYFNYPDDMLLLTVLFTLLFASAPTYLIWKMVKNLRSEPADGAACYNQTEVDHRMQKVLRYEKFTVGLHFGAILTMIVIALCFDVAVYGFILFGVTIHMIFSIVIIWNILDEESERSVYRQKSCDIMNVVGHWKIGVIVSYLLFVVLFAFLMG